MDDHHIHKIQISGTTLASVLHRFFSSSGDIHGLLFGHVSFSTTISLSDDLASNFSSVTPMNSASSSGADGPTLTATITDFLSIPSHFPLPLQHKHREDPSCVLLGWFSGRRKTPLRPSLKDSTTTISLSSSVSHSFTPQNSPYPLSLPPSLFLLLSTPSQEQLIHTHEYKAFQYRISTDSFDPKSLDVINIGPSFRSHYGSFSPISPFPSMTCDLRGPNAMAEDEKAETLVGIKRGLKDQKELDLCAEGFEIGRLSKLMGSDSSNYTAELEHLYDKMLLKLDNLARSVETSSAKVLEQEKHNMKLRKIRRRRNGSASVKDILSMWKNHKHKRNATLDSVLKKIRKRVPVKGYNRGCMKDVEAVRAYDEAAKAMYGHDAVLNFPDYCVQNARLTNVSLRQMTSSSASGKSKGNLSHSEGDLSYLSRSTLGIIR